MRSFRQCSPNQSEKLTRCDPSRNRRATPWNKTTCATVSIGMAVANSPTDIEISAGRWVPQPGPSARTYDRINPSEVQSENVIACRHNTGTGGCRKPVPGNGPRAETFGREHPARYLPACRHRRSERRHDNPALRVPVRIRPPCSMEGALGPGPVMHDCSEVVRENGLIEAPAPSCSLEAFRLRFSPVT